MQFSLGLIPRLGAPMGLRGVPIMPKVGEGMLKAGPGSPMVGGGLGGPMNVSPIIPSRVDEGLRRDMAGGVLGI